NLRLNPTQRRRPAMRVHIVVAEKLPARAVQLVGAVFDGYVHYGARAVPVFGGVRIALYAELLYGIDRGKHDVDAIAAEAGGVRIVIDPVQEVVVLQRAVAVDADRAAEALIGIVSGPGRKQNELGVVALVQRQLFDLLALDHLPARAGIGL